MQAQRPLSHLRSTLPTRSAFSLVEIVLVLTIIALLAGSAIFMLKGQFAFGQEVRVQGDIKAIEPALATYRAKHFGFPSTEEGLEALVTKGMLVEIPIDPWGEPYRYRYPAERSKFEYDIFSSGLDKTENTEDDMGNWKTEGEE